MGRGGIKKLKSSSASKSRSSSNSKSPKIKITNKNSPFKKDKKEEGADPSYTYSSWLDDVVSDTECKYISRGRPMPAKINGVDYTFEVQTELGLVNYKLVEGKIKAIEKENDNVDMDVDAENEN